MKLKIKHTRFLHQPVILVLITIVCACNKKDFLNEKPRTDIVVPSSLSDFRALLDRDVLFKETPALGELSTDDYFISSSQAWQTLQVAYERSHYKWEKDIFKGQGDIGDWNLPYQQVYYANIVLEGLKNLTVSGTEQPEWNNIKGSALFLRAYAFYNLAQVFAPVYDSSRAAADLGIPLRLKPDIHEVSVRSTVTQTYEQIIADLKEAKDLLTPLPANSRNRPSTAAAYALLARVYLGMRAYDLAGSYADSSLQLYNTLIDYNTVSRVSSIPFSRTNEETLYQSVLYGGSAILRNLRLIIPGFSIDTILYRSYDQNDLRKSIYFSVIGEAIFLKSDYSGVINKFSGLATDELYLIRAECNARKGNVTAAMGDLNALLMKRWKTGTFTPITAVNMQDALFKILTERRKELVLRGRWSDLRRLNKRDYPVTLKRMLDGDTYTLPPDDPRYVLPIPPDEIAMSGIPQNQR